LKGRGPESWCTSWGRELSPGMLHGGRELHLQPDNLLQARWRGQPAARVDRGDHGAVTILSAHQHHPVHGEMPRHCTNVDILYVESCTCKRIECGTSSFDAFL
jgi:hypothetical protein